MRIKNHPILGSFKKGKKVKIILDGKKVEAYEGEMIATAIIATGKKHFRFTEKYYEPRGLFCAIGRCTDCAMEVDGRVNVRTCITPVKDGMVINTQKSIGEWKGV